MIFSQIFYSPVVAHYHPPKYFSSKRIFPIDNITPFVVKFTHNNHLVIIYFVKDEIFMKNFSTNNKNQTATADEKLISYDYSGGIYAVIIFFLSFIGTAAFILGIITAVNWNKPPFTPSVLFLVLYICLFVSCSVGIVIFSIKQAKNTNTGFEIYSDRVIIKDGVKPVVPYSKRTLVFAIICSVIIPFYSLYWRCMMAYNIRLLTHRQNSLAGECICLALVPFYNFYWVYTGSNQLRKEFIKRGIECTFVPGIMLLIELIGYGIIPLAIMQHHINFLSDEHVLTDEEYAQHVAENTYPLQNVNTLSASTLYFVVESDKGTRSVMLTSRDFKRNLQSLLASNA